VIDADNVRRVLAVAAHPDDIDFGAAGTVAVLTDSGIEVSYCLVTDGDAGGFDPAVPRESIGAIRRAEQVAAAKEVGVTDVHFLGYPDGRVEASIALRRDIARVIRMVRPDRLICQSPVRNFTRLFASHPDHLATGEATLCAVYPDARNEFTFTELIDEGHAPWVVREVWMSAGPEPNHAVDITETFDRKMAALMRHESQMPDPEGIRQRVRAWVEATAKQFGLGDGRLAEAFQVIDTH
jgi:LmbE family N-acetylglucosaminyl deacetylase